MLSVGTGSVFLTAGDLDRLSTVIRFELFSANQFRFFAQAIWLLILCALVWLLASAVTGPLFAYPWSN
jgi:thiosulfate reductase cytochrome b subunit